ncbi:MAG: serine protease, partial [Solirubrobacteraceae bacterium]|nr:serine protease [Solirubrobacteraceae bacterium]
MFHPLLRLLGVLTVCVLAAVLPSGAGAAMKGAAADGGLTQRAKAWFSASTSKQPVAERLIVGGAVIPITSAPWQVNVWGLSGGSGSECGGAILSSTVIITAAHCVDDKTAGADPRNGGIGVWAGISNINAQTPGDNFQERAVVESRIHPQWRGSGTTGDVAVLKLASPLVLDGLTAKAIALPALGALPVNDPFGVGVAMSASGYGHTVGGGTIDGPLRSVTMTITDPDFCDIADNAVAICGSNPTGTTCQGDSGGPVVIPGAAPVLVGLVSNGPAGCGPGTKDNYVSLWAPENRAFVDGNNAPPLAPRLTGISSIGGAPNMRVGETVTCTAATFTGNPTVWVELISSDGVVLRSDNALQTSFALTEAQVGKTLQCRSFG